MIAEILLAVFLATALTALVYLIALLIVKRIKKSSLEDAHRIVSKTLHKFYNLFSEPLDKIIWYPVLIGYNGYDFRPFLINKAFAKMERYWQIVYFDVVFPNLPNIIVYQFRVELAIHQDMTQIRLENLAQTVSEEALAIHMRSYNCYVPVDNFIAIRLDGDILKVAIAKNNLGFEEIKHLRRH